MTEEFECLVCENCGSPTRLPQPKLAATIRRQPSWRSSNAPINFLCPGCKHVYEYTAEEIRPWSVGKTDQNPQRTPQRVLCGGRVVMSCGIEGCVSQVAIRIVVALEGDIREVAAENLAQATAHLIPCGAGHLLDGQSVGKQGKAFDFAAEFEDWAV